MKMKNLLMVIFLTVCMVISLSCSGFGKPSCVVSTVAEDGIFTMSPSGSYPVFDYTGQHERTYIGYYSSDHTINFRYWEHTNGYLSNAVTLWRDWGYSSNGDVLGDDHANPAVIVLQYQKGTNVVHNGKLLVATAEHASAKEDKGRLQVRRSSKPEDIYSWEDAVQLRSTYATYARLIETFDGKIWLFCRLHGTESNSRATFYYWISEDAGDQWIGPVPLIDIDAETKDRTIYMAVAKNMASDELHFMFNLAVRNDPKKGVSRYQDIYYVRYNVSKSTWHRIDGTAIDLPLTLSETDTVYKTDNTRGSEGWTYLSNLTVDRNNRPYLLSCTDQDRGAAPVGGIGDVLRHSYDEKGQRWITEKVCDTARFYYLNLAALAPYSGDIVYACVPDEGGRGQLQKWQKKEGRWIKVLDITKGSSGQNARPYVTQNTNSVTRVFWSDIMRYGGSPYADWESKILGFTDF